MISDLHYSFFKKKNLKKKKKLHFPKMFLKHEDHSKSQSKPNTTPLYTHQPIINCAIIYIWQDSNCASAILQSSYSENHFFVVLFVVKLQNLCLQSYYENSAIGDFLGNFQNFGNSYSGRLLKHSPAIISLVPFFNFFQKVRLRHKFGICFFESNDQEVWSWTQKKFDFKIMLS